MTIAVGVGVGPGWALPSFVAPAPPAPGTAITPADFPEHIAFPSGTQWYASPTGNAGNDGLSPATPKTYKGALAAASSGDLIWIADGRISESPPIVDGSDPNYKMPAKTLTICAMNRGAYAADPLGDGKGAYGPKLDHKVIIDGLWQFPAGADYTFLFVDHTAQDCFTGWPDAWAGETWRSVGLGSDLSYNNQMLRGEGGRITTWRCGWYQGYGNDWVPYDATVKYPECNSPNPWYFLPWDPVTLQNFRITDDIDATTSKTPFAGHGDEDWSPYNTTRWGPGAVGKRWASYDIRESNLRDLSSGTAGIGLVSSEAGGKAILANNIYERIVLDHITVSTESAEGAPAPITHGNIIIDSLGVAKDSGNPHSDIFQAFCREVGGTVTSPLQMWDWQANNNFAFSTPGARGFPQGIFWQASWDHQVTTKAAYMAPRLRNNIIIGAQKGYVDEGAPHLYARGNIAVQPVDLAAGDVGMVASFETSRYRYADASQTDLRSDAGPSKPLLLDSIYETIGTNADMASINNLSVGARGISVPLSDVFQGLVDTSALATPNDWWQAVQRTEAHASKGPQYASLRDYLNQPMDWTGERPWVGFSTLEGAAVSTEIASDLSIIHGGNNGDLLAMTEFAGGEWRILDRDETTVITDWSSDATGDLVVGKFIQLRTTTPATNATLAPVSFKVGTYAFVWNVTTISDNAYPAATFDGAVRFKASTTAPTPVETKTLWFYFRGKLASAGAGTTAPLVSGHTGNALIGALSVNPANKFSVTLRDATGTTVANINNPPLTVPRDDTSLVEILYAVNTAAATFGAGTRCYQRVGGENSVSGWQENVPLTAGSWVQDGLIDLRPVSGGFALWFLGNASTFYAGELQALAIGADAIDITREDIRAKFGVDFVGEHFTGPTGASPLWAFVGKKTLLDGLTPNLGSAPQPTKDGAGTITAGTAQTWPVS